MAAGAQHRGLADACAAEQQGERAGEGGPHRLPLPLVQRHAVGTLPATEPAIGQHVRRTTVEQLRLRGLRVGTVDQSADTLGDGVFHRQRSQRLPAGVDLDDGSVLHREVDGGADSCAAAQKTPQ